MSHYKPNLRDIEFNLFEVFRVQERFDSAPFDGVDVDTARGVLTELAGLAVGPLAESYVDGDRNPAVFDPATHSVTLPESLKRSYRALWEGEWWRLGLPAELGGYQLPPSVQWAAAELILGSNPAVFMYLAGPNFAAIVHRNGTELQQHWAELMIERGWAATMVLTEPDAGSDVGAGRTKAVQQPDGSWHLRRREAVHHLRRARPDREHHAPGARPAGGSGDRAPGRHQGAVAVPGAQVPLRPAERRARRAQRRVRDQRRAQDGPEGLDHLRADASASTASRRSATCSASGTPASSRCSR